MTTATPLKCLKSAGHSKRSNREAAAPQATHRRAAFITAIGTPSVPSTSRLARASAATQTHGVAL